MHKPPSSPRVVVAHVPDAHDHASAHERDTLLDYAKRLARLRGESFGGMFRPGQRYRAAPYFVPSSTLTLQQAQALGITGPDDLFGGVVPDAFVASKAISHPLYGDRPAAPPSWRPEMSDRLRGAVLGGYAAFSLDDARLAGDALLRHGPVRLKPVRATGGRGQSVAHDALELQGQLEQIGSEEIGHGLVLEQNLEEVRTFSVGQVRVGDLLASYHGTQALTRDNQDREVFGGSDLVVVLGGFDALTALELPPEVRRAIDQARQYDAAVRTCFPAFYASRSNYDVAVGRAAAGRACSGVLEQSWRAGGATGPELVALEQFRERRDCRVVRVAGAERFGPAAVVPPGAHVHFDGTDPEVGRLVKYSCVVPL
ncbi:DUF3182 family protein [Ramlibacter sp. AW1]|uniref:DUF3182 family protein n=1 Tax=Ramlibacter aurantiacus TaxID=2801330 RepID=A0A936ZDD3_9BURK|nr:DUF3182 family protein [Ramlibacter aurantiacus]